MDRVKLLSLLMLALVAIGGLLLTLEWRSQLHQLPSVQDEQPDVFASQIKTLQFDPQGKKIRTFNADFMLLFEQSEKASANQPVLRAILDNGQPIRIRADQGKLQGRDTVNLLGDVRIDTNTPAKLPLQLRSASLTYSIINALATTSDQVTISSRGRFDIKANGLTANFNKEQFILHDRVRGSYVPITR